MENRFSQLASGTNQAFLLLCLLVVLAICGGLYVAKRIPTEAAACTKTCAARGMKGELFHIYSREQTAGVRGQGPTACRCQP